MRNLSLPYIAGFFDGEGSVSIAKRDKKYVLCLSIPNTNLRVLQLIHQQVHGPLNQRRVPVGHKPKWQLDIYNKHALSFLESIYPYLRIKSLVAYLALCFARHKQEIVEKMGSRRISESEREIREAFYTLLPKVNDTYKASRWQTPSLSTDYLAGLFDAEGSVSITLSGYNNYGYALHVNIVNTHRSICEAVKELYGGGVQAHRIHAPHLPRFAWYASHLLATRFLKDVFPYLVVKVEQAWIGLCFQQHKTQYFLNNGNHQLSESEREIRTTAREMVARINGRWKRPLTKHLRSSKYHSLEDYRESMILYERGLTAQEIIKRLDGRVCQHIIYAWATGKTHPPGIAREEIRRIRHHLS